MTNEQNTQTWRHGRDDGEYNILQNHVFNETFYSCNMIGCGMDIANEYKHEKVPQ